VTTTTSPAPTLPPLRPYQLDVARAVAARVARHHGGSLSVEIARQGGKNELSARVELALLLAHSTTGGSIVKCAPTLAPQARLSQARLRDRAQQAGLAGHVIPHGNEIRCGRARAVFLSADPAANVVGHTADLLLEVDEAQDVDADTFDRAFRPMAASTNAPVVLYGTPWGARSLLERAKAEHRAAERAGGPPRHYRYDWEQVAAHVPPYRAYVEAERARLGERHPLFRTQYLLEVLHEADRLLDAAALAQLQGEHERQSMPRAGERYVAGLDLAGPDLASAGPGGDRDWTVLTIARAVPRTESAPLLEVVEHAAWQGEATEALVDRLADLLRTVWRVRRVAVDATGLGAPIADLLAARLGRHAVEPVAFSAERKSRLGFALLAAVHSGRLRLYRQDGSRDWAACRAQLELARAAYLDGQRLRFDVDPADGHDDHLMSLALAVWAARHEAATRTARGRAALASPANLTPVPRAEGASV
jgi:hypothetical protein